MKDEIEHVPVHEKIIKEFRNKKRGKVLDTGAGSGNLSVMLDSLGFKVVPCDIDPKLFKGKMKCIRADLNEKFPFKDNSFDYVVAAEVLEHIENSHFLIREIRRVLKKGGELVLTTPNIANVFSRIKFFLTGTFFTFGKKERKLGHINPVPFWKIFEILKENKFKILKVEANNYLTLSGVKSASNFFKRKISLLAYYTFYSVLQPKNMEILQGDSLIVFAKKI